jgi:site-specific recombinase XerC
VLAKEQGAHSARNDSARQALADYAAPLLGVEPSAKAVAEAWPTPQTRPAAPLWRSERATALSVREMSRMVQGLVRDCAARHLAPPDATSHGLRHTFATRYLATHPHDLVGLAHLLGHSALEATRIDVQPTDEDLAARVNRIDLKAYGGGAATVGLSCRWEVVNLLSVCPV